MPLAGEVIVAGQVPGERIATTVVTADSVTWTDTETVAVTVTAPLVDGRTYRVRSTASIRSTVAGDSDIFRIREDNLAGVQLQVRRVDIPFNNTTMAAPILEMEFTATATGDKTFVLTGVRSSGTGTHFVNAQASGPAYLYVDYIRG